MIEVLKQMYQLLLTEPHAPTVCDQLESMLKEAIAELESQEPIAYVNVENRRLEFATDYVKWDTPTTIKLDKIPLYTHPPQRTWVGLTLPDKEKLHDQFEDWNYPVSLVSAIEAKLKEKNT